MSEALFAFNAIFDSHPSFSPSPSGVLSYHLRVVQKRGSLLVGWNDILLSSEADLLAKDTRHSDEQSSDEESGHNRESKDPLEGNGFDEELMDTKGSREDA